jgi:DNA-directed RNA polymerase subunit RPC12/RpoP
MRKGLVFGSGAVNNMNERVKCPKCGAKYDMVDEAASEAMGGLCAACWHEFCVENKKLKVESEKVVDKSEFHI